jgi:hypothetical protein
MRSSQQQSSGNNSTNLLAKENIVIVNTSGADPQEVRRIVHDMLEAYRDNFLKLSEVAAGRALARAQEFTIVFLNKLLTVNPSALSNVSDPDVQRAIINAQIEFACSGEEDLQQVLIDLLVDRASRSVRDIVTLVLNESITTVPKLTADQRSAIAICFMVRYTAYTPATLDEFYKVLEKNCLPIIVDLPTRYAAYQHIQYVGAAAIISFEHVSIEHALLHQNRRFFFHGTKRGDLPERLQEWADDPNLFMVSYRNLEELQVCCNSQEALDSAAAYLGEHGGDDKMIAGYRNLYKSSVMPEHEVKADVIAKVPGSSKLFDAWNDSSLPGMSLTSVGLAIGHAYWRRTNRDLPGLSRWL